ncbi:MAG: hypothetical protein JEZ03_05975 [Bacteroidales bacterium]|nr:hypothetical protein [Bacteroidales bacterium]
MKKTLTSIIALFLFLGTHTFAQENVNLKYAKLLTFDGNLTTSSGSSNTQLHIGSSFDYFISDYVFVGMGIEYASLDRSSSRNSQVAIGPNIGVVLAKNSPVYPYFKAGVELIQSSVQGYNFDYYGSNSNYHSKSTAYNKQLAMGIIVPFNNRFAFNGNLSYNMLDFPSSSVSGRGYSESYFMVNIGFTGLFTKK